MLYLCQQSLLKYPPKHHSWNISLRVNVHNVHAFCSKDVKLVEFLWCKEPHRKTRGPKALQLDSVDRYLMVRSLMDTRLVRIQTDLSGYVHTEDVIILIYSLLYLKYSYISRIHVLQSRNYIHRFCVSETMIHLAKNH